MPKKIEEYLKEKQKWVTHYLGCLDLILIYALVKSARIKVLDVTENATNIKTGDCQKDKRDSDMRKAKQMQNIGYNDNRGKKWKIIKWM